MTPSREALSPPGLVFRGSRGLVGEWRRALALALGSVLVGSYLSVFYQVTNVAGGVDWFAGAVGLAVTLATLSARLVSVRRGLLAGGGLVLVGVAAYVASVPGLAVELLTVDFVRRWLAYLTGITVLQFRRVDLWAAVVAPGPAYLSWFLLLRRRYAASALVGGGMLLFFTLTGDAGATTALVGWSSLLGLLGAGTLEREAGSLDRLLELGFVVALGGLFARRISLVPDSRSRGSAGGGGGGRAGGGRRTTQLDTAGPRAGIYGAISLAPDVLFTIEADEAAYWHVSGYDRYTGTDWLRTGEVTPYPGGGLDPPRGTTRRIEQSVRAAAAVRTLPAAWKPLDLEGVPADQVGVSELGDLVPRTELESGHQYRVTSELPVRDVDDLRDVTGEIPQDVAERYGRLPGDTPDRVRALATELVGETASAVDAAHAVQRWLQDHKRYSLEVERPSGEVVDAFLFDMDAGYCVYFATAMAVLLRAADLPARFVLGYGPGQRVADDRWVVRGLDSHAWVQAYLPGVGWTTFDPTPPAERNEYRRGLLDAARDAGAPDVDTAETAGRPYDPVMRSMASIPSEPDVAATATPTTSTAANATAEVAADDRSGPRPEDMVTTETPTPGIGPVDAVGEAIGDRDRVSLLAGGVATAIGLHWLGVPAWVRDLVRIHWQPPSDSPRRDVKRACHRLEVALARRGRPRGDGETTRQYLERTGERRTQAAHRRLVELYERATYGGGVTRAEADEAIALVDGLVGRDR